MKNFEDYLKEIHAGQADGVLDDDMPDAFDAWLADLQIDEVIHYADEYANLFKDPGTSPVPLIKGGN